MLLVLLGPVLPGRSQPSVREANTTLKLPEAPGAFGYSFRRILPELTFPNAVALATPPGETNRLFVVERLGRIAVITNLAAPTREVFLDVASAVRLDNFNEMGLLGLAFHPQYATNGRFFVFYTATASNTRQNRLSEFRALPGSPNLGDRTSEKILIQQRDDAVNHNGGDLHFGPDGYLYISLGDEGGANDQYRNSQRITNDFFAGVLRIDVDQRPGSLPPNPHPSSLGGYSIPSDNPFVGATQFLNRAVDPARVRTEFWAVGLRNPWRMAFDPATGELWIGDVGQDARESIVITRAGANHGWAFREADIAGPMAGAPADFLTNPAHRYVPPLWSYPHRTGTNGGFSVTGGFVYRGSRLAQLHGAYLFADYVTGNVWSLRRSPASGRAEVAYLTGYANIAAFGRDPRNGDVLAVNHASGQIARLDYSDRFNGPALPGQLSATGAFRDLATMAPEAGIVPYQVNLSFWSDGAFKKRWFSIPDPGQVIGYQQEGPWITPPGTVWIKHFDMELTEGVPASRRRLETRFLVRNSSGVYGVTYRWNREQTDATLVGEGGEEEDLSIVETSGNTRLQRWRYPSRGECLSCHNAPAGGSLSFNSAQLHRGMDEHGAGPNQIDALAAAGYFAPGTAAARAAYVPALAAPTNETASVTWRARSWLDVNCGYCHQPGGQGGAQFDARLQTSSERTRMIFGPLNSALDLRRSVVTPGSVELSELHARLSTRGPRQMPPIASTRIDPEGTRLIERWIREVASTDTFDAWIKGFFDDPSVPRALPDADPDRDGRSNFDEFLLASSPREQDAPWGLRVEPAANGRVRWRVVQPANRRVVIEQTGSLDGPVVWTAIKRDESSAPFSSAAMEIVMEEPAADAARYYRATLFAP